MTSELIELLQYLISEISDVVPRFHVLSQLAAHALSATLPEALSVLLQLDVCVGINNMGLFPSLACSRVLGGSCPV